MKRVFLLVVAMLLAALLMTPMKTNYEVLNDDGNMMLVRYKSLVLDFYNDTIVKSPKVVMARVTSITSNSTGKPSATIELNGKTQRMVSAELCKLVRMKMTEDSLVEIEEHWWPSHYIVLKR